MVEIRIPAELQVYWDQVVRDRFGGDEERALEEAVVRLIQKEKAELVNDEKFNLAVRKANEWRLNAAKITQDEFSSALAKRQRRMEKARELFGKLGKSSEEELGND